MCLATLLNGTVVAQERATKKVLILGIDGCRTDALLSAEAPNLHALKNDGAFSDNNDVLGNRDTEADTVTGPGWSSALTGVWADKHGVKDNSFQGSNTNEYPTFFRRVQEAHPNAECAAYVSWKPFSDHLFSESENCDPQVRSTFLILNGPSVVEGAIKERTANVDVAVTALSHLGIAIKPEWKLDGHAVGPIELK